MVRLLNAVILWLLVSCSHCIEMSCSEIQKSYVLKGFVDTDVPIYAVNGKYSGIYNYFESSPRYAIITNQV